MNTLDPTTVRQTLAQRGTRFVTVQVIKKDGTLRKINGLLRATSKMVGGDRGDRQHEMLRANDLVAIYSLRDRAWRSFNAHNVVEIR